jgi:hypothetical protein
MEADWGQALRSGTYERKLVGGRYFRMVTFPEGAYLKPRRAKTLDLVATVFMETVGLLDTQEGGSAFFSRRAFPFAAFRF